MEENSIPRSGDSSSIDNENSERPKNALNNKSAEEENSRLENDGDRNSNLVTRFVLPAVNGSPPQILAIDEIVNIFKNIQNMELAHEIALNPEFQLQPYEPPGDSLESRIRGTMHKAFWDMLSEELEKTPPRFDFAIKLLAEIKESFPQVISKKNHRTLEHINEVLDEAVILQQAESGVLDFKSYANFIVEIMAKSCAPVRDEAVRKLSDADNVVDMFRGILEVMSLMKLDMANFLINYARNNIMAYSVKYEKEKFKEYQHNYKVTFPATEAWLNRNRICDSNQQLSSNEESLYNAYIELIDWPENAEFPEVISTDKERIEKLAQRAKRICIAASVMVIIPQRVYNHAKLAQEILVLLNDIQTNDNEVLIALEGIFEYLKNFLNDAARQQRVPLITEDMELMLKTQILQLANNKAPVRELLWKRLRAFAHSFIHPKQTKLPIPAGYAEYDNELETFASALQRIIMYNHSVFGEYFIEVLDKQVSNLNDLN